MTATPTRDRADGDRAQRIVDVSYRGRSWQLHDTGGGVWFVYPWGSTARLWGRFRAVASAERAVRWEAVNRAGDVSRFGSFADAAKFACLPPDNGRAAAGGRRDADDVVVAVAARLSRPSSAAGGVLGR